jgi:hypothetical protein
VALFQTLGIEENTMTIPTACHGYFIFVQVCMQCPTVHRRQQYFLLQRLYQSQSLQFVA